LKRESPPGTARWTPPDQFHITLKFLGDVPADQVEALKNSLVSICAGSSALQITARGIGFFPNARKPRVIWAGAHDDRGGLTELHRRIDEALRSFAPCERAEKFTGHITLGRFKPGHHAVIPKMVEQAEAFRERHFGDWPATEVELVRSELTSAGAEHVAIATYTLAGVPS
jgi:2'-5' RNA ligase